MWNREDIVRCDTLVEKHCLMYIYISCTERVIYVENVNVDTIFAMESNVESQECIEGQKK